MVPRLRRAWRATIVATLAIPFLYVAAPAAQAAPIGSGFTVTPADLAYILKQIKIAEAHVANTTSATGPCGALLGDGANQISSPVLPLGLRTVDGSCNNLTAAGRTYGAADQLFVRLGGKDFAAAENAPAGLFGPGSPSFPTTYADKGADNVVVDSEPRTISNLIVDQTANNPAAVAAAGYPVRSQTAGNGSATMIDGKTLFIPNVTTDAGLSAPYNGWFTLFGQFFDHGIDQTVKSGGTVIIPLKADDPLIAGPDRIPGTDDDPKPGDADYVAPSMRFMALTRAANQPGPDGKLGTADDVQDATNTDTPFVDNSQTYTSHASHQVFLREYDASAKATGRLLSGAAGGLPTWADVKAQASGGLGLKLTDADVLDVPMILTDAYGRFVPGPARGLPQYVTRTGLVEGDRAHPVAVPANTLHFDTPFLSDIAHNADPTPQDTDHNPATPPVAPRPDADKVASTDFAGQPAGTYDDELLDMHYIAGDGRANENIGLTSIHDIFHSEHNRLVDDIERVLSTAGGSALPEWMTGDDWNGERIFQAARFINEMEYQHLVFEEFARKVAPAVNPFAGAYSQTELNPAIYAEFAHAVYRFGHSMLTETIARKKEDGSDDSISLLDGFLNPGAYTDNGTLSPEQADGEIVMGMSDQVGNELDEFMTDTLRNNLLGLPMDLGAINIARGRSEGVPSLNTFRAVLHDKTGDSALTPYTSWVDFGEHLKHPESLINFVAAYGQHPTVLAATTVAAKRAAARAIVDPAVGDTQPADAADFMNATGAWTTAETGLNRVDLWVGGLAEETNPFGGLLGSTFNYVFENQLTALQNGDRFYYLGRTVGMNLRTQLEGNTFAELIQRTTTAHSLKADSFATADCKFDVGHLDGTVAGYLRDGNTVADDPSTTCDESARLIRMPDGTIKYRSRNTVDKPGINGQSVYAGTDQNDRVYGGNDNDTIWGGEGDDRLEGGAGNDGVLGGEGDDIVTDTGGDDFLRGGPGNDAIDGGPGLDTVAGGDGRDFITGGANANEEFAGEGDDIVLAGDGDDTVFGDAGDDWEEGGAGNDTLQGDSGNPFTQDDSNAPGNDVLIGQGGDDEYDLEGGDDIAVGGPGSDKVLGGSGFDWGIASSPGPSAASSVAQGGDDEAVEADLAKPVEPVKAGVIDGGVRDRYREVEALSGGTHNDVLAGDDLIPSANGTTGGGLIGCDALDAAGVARISGLDQIVTTFPTPAAAVGNKTGRDCDLHGNAWAEGNILLGGPGDDTLTGRGGNDILDGDRYLTVHLDVRDADGTVVRTAPSMASLQAEVFAGTINPASISVVRQIETSATSDVDTAVFAGTSTAYSITTRGDATIVSGPDGTDTLRNIEKLKFSDTTVTLGAALSLSAIAGDRQATIAITAPSSIGGLPVTGFTLVQSGGTTPVTTDLPATARTFVATGLTNGTAYTFRIRAVTASGAGEFTAATDAVIPAAPATDPGHGKGTDGTETGPGSGSGSGGADSPAPSPTPSPTPIPTPVPTVTVPPVDPAPTTTPTTPVVATTPGQPVDVSATAGDTTARVQWTAPAGDGGSPITGYEVQTLDLITFDPVGGVVTIPAGTTAATVTGLADGMPYWFRVRAMNAVGKGAFSNGSNPVTPMAVVAPGAPAIGTVTAGTGQALIGWSPPDSDGGAAISRYEVQPVDATGAALGPVRTAAAGATQMWVTGLTNGRAYRFAVRAVNEAGAGEWSVASAPVTPASPRTVPGAVATVTAAPGSAGGSRTVTVHWNPPAGTGGSPIVSFRVVRQPLSARGRAAGPATTVAFSAATRTITYTAPGTVAAGTRYRFTVFGVNATGVGAGKAVDGWVR